MAHQVGSKYHHYNMYPLACSSSYHQSSYFGNMSHPDPRHNIYDYNIYSHLDNLRIDNNHQVGHTYHQDNMYYLLHNRQNYKVYYGASTYQHKEGHHKPRPADSTSIRQN
jgi:hypothetical protein